MGLTVPPKRHPQRMAGGIRPETAPGFRKYFCSICLKTVLLSAWLASSAWAQSNETKLFEIPPQSLPDALEQFSEIEGMQLSYPADLVRGLESPGLKGRYTPDEALKILLDDSGLVPRITEDRVITLSDPRRSSLTTESLLAMKPMDDFLYAAAEPEAQSAAGPVEQEEMMVRGVATSGYNVLNASTATKTDTPIMDTPVSIQIVPKRVMIDQQAIFISDALKNVSGVQRQNNYGTSYDNFIVRGFSTATSTYRNGLLQTNFGFETTNLQQIEVLKGPAAVLYGRIEPGGLINLVTKRPQEQPYYAIQQQFGSYDLYRTTAEATGPMSADGSLLYRLDFAYQNSDSFQDFVFLDRVFVSPSLTWRPTDNLEFNLTYEYQDDDLNFANGIPALGRSPAPIPISFSSDDGDDFYKQDRNLVEFNWSYEFIDDWKLTNRFMSYFADFDQLDVIGFGSVDANDPIMERYLWNVAQERNTYTTNLDLTGSFDTWGARHDILVGFDYYRFEQEARGVCCPAVAPINIFNPVYGIVDEAAISAATGENYFFTSKNDWYGVYFQDQVSLWDKLHLLAGGRYNWTEAGTGFSRTSLTDAQPRTVAVNKFNPRVGLVYQPWPWLSVYGNYVESFGRNNGRPAPGEAPFSPEEGTQYEGGIKTEFWNGRLTSTLAFYHLTKTNVLTSDPVNPRFQRAIGKARSQGIELDIAGQVTDGMNLIASYAFTDARITSDNRGNQGHRLPNVAEHTASFWTTYELTDRITVGSGVFVASNKEGDPQNSFELPGYARWDMMAAYRFEVAKSRLTAQLNVNNILDKKYYESVNTNDGAPRGQILAAEPLTVLGSIRLEY